MNNLANVFEDRLGEIRRSLDVSVNAWVFNGHA
jgi:hypothetical protein